MAHGESDGLIVSNIDIIGYDTLSGTQCRTPKRPSLRRGLSRRTRSIHTHIAYLCRKSDNIANQLSKRSDHAHTRHGRYPILRSPTLTHPTRRVRHPTAALDRHPARYRPRTTYVRGIAYQSRNHVKRLLVRYEPAAAHMETTSSDYTPHTDIKEDLLLFAAEFGVYGRTNGVWSVDKLAWADFGW